MKDILLLLWLFGVTSANAQNPNWYCNPDEKGIKKRWYDTEIGKQKALIFYPKGSREDLNLVVFIHGDSPFGDPVYQYNISRNISEITNAVTVAILRPGYRDGCGDASEGIRGLTMGDNYTEEVVQAIDSVISTIKREQNPRQTIVMGHSGGAALTALLAQSNPGLMDQSILVACPCNLNAWRKSMQNLTEDPNWSNPMGGLSPINGVSNLDLNKPIHLYVGEKDVVAPPFLTKEFHDTASEMGASVQMSIISGEDHESVMRRAVLTKIFKDLSLWAQANQDFGYADRSIPELAQFEYYRGEWTSEMEMKQDDGTFKKLEVVATIKGKFLDDHRTFQSQFTTPGGFFSTNISTFNTTTKEWHALFLNARAQRWHEFTSKVVDGKMTTIVKGGYSGKEDFDVKVVDVVISDSHYLKNVYNSRDQMKTWDLVYKMDVKKVE